MLIEPFIDYKKIIEKQREDILKFSELSNTLVEINKKSSILYFIEEGKKPELYRLISDKIRENIKLSILGELSFDKQLSETDYKWYEYLLLAARNYQKLYEIFEKHLSDEVKFQLLFMSIAEFHNSLQHACSFSLAKEGLVLLKKLVEESKEKDKYISELYSSLLHFYKCDFASCKNISDKIEKEISDDLSNNEKLDIVEILDYTLYIYILKILSLLSEYLIKGVDSNGRIEEFFGKVKTFVIYSGRADLLFIIDKLYYSFKILSDISIWNLRKFMDIKDDATMNTYINSKISQNRYFFFPSQYECLSKGIFKESYKNLLLAMPTASGKTFIAELFMYNELVNNIHKKVVYMVPSRALAREKYLQFTKSFSNLGINVNVCQLTGDVILDAEKGVKENNLIILTPEKFDFILRNKFYGEEVGSLICDEFHNIRTGFRGIRMQFNILRMRNSYKESKIFLISAILSTANFKEIIDWLGADFSFETTWKPTFLKIGIYDLTRENKVTFDDGSFLVPTGIGKIRKNSYIQQTAKLALEFGKQGPCLIYTSYKNENYIYNIANNLDKEIKEENLQDFINIEKNKQYLEKLSRFLGKKEELYNLFRKGIGIHKSDLPHKIREITESCLMEGGLAFVVSTSTLAEGVNLPIRTIIIPKPKLGKEDMNNALFFNLIGRAGRPFQENEGQIIMLTSKDYDTKKIEKYISLSTQDIESIRTPLIRIVQFSNALDNGNLRDLSYAQREVEISKAVLYSVLLATICEKKIKFIKGNEEFLKEIIIGEEKNNEVIELKKEIIKILDEAEDHLIRSGSVRQIENSKELEITSFGKAVYKTGYCPKSCQEIIQNLLPVIEVLKKNEKLNRFTIVRKYEVIESIFNIIELPIETEMYFSDGLPKNYKNILYEWMKGHSLNILAEKYFYGKKSTAMIVVEGLLAGYSAWFLYAFYVLLSYYIKQEKLLDIAQIRPVGYLSSYVYYGTMDPIALKILENDTSKEILRDDLLNLFKELGSNNINNIIKEKVVGQKYRELILQDFLMEDKDIFITILDKIIKKVK